MGNLGDAMRDPEGYASKKPNVPKPLRLDKAASAARKALDPTKDIMEADIKMISGEVNKTPFSPSKLAEKSPRQQALWLKKMQTNIRDLFGYINDPNVRVETNFSRLQDPGDIKRFLDQAKSFIDLKNADQDSVERAFADMTDIYGAEGLFNLGLAMKRARRRFFNGTNVIRLSLERGSSNYSTLTYDEAPGIKAVSDFERARPIRPEASQDAAAAIKEKFKGLLLDGMPVKVRITDKLPGKDKYVGIVESHSLGGGHNEFEVWINPDGTLSGNTRWKKIEGAQNAEEFVKKVLEINVAMDEKAEIQHEDWEKGDRQEHAFRADQYEHTVPAQVEDTMRFIKQAKKDRIIEGKANMRTINGDILIGSLSYEEVAEAYAQHLALVEEDVARQNDAPRRILEDRLGISVARNLVNSYKENYRRRVVEVEAPRMGPQDPNPGTIDDAALRRLERDDARRRRRGEA